MDNNTTEQNEEYPYSMGTTPAVNQLINMINSEPNSCNVIVFNIATIIRNCLEKNSTSQDLFDSALAEAKKIEQVLTDTLNASSIKDPVLIWYTAPYEKILNPLFLRPFTPSRKLINVVRVLMLRQLREMSRGGSKQIGRVRIQYAPLIPKLNTVTQLNTRIRSFGTTNHVVMVSHYSIDLHLMDAIKRLKLVECFTGKIIEPIDFGTKVFKNQALPFNVVLHCIFGDKELMRPTATPAEKKRVIELAIKERWRHKTKEYVYESIAANFNNLFKLVKDNS